MIEKYNGVIDKIQKIPDKMNVLTEMIKKIWLQNSIVNDLLEYLANNEVCATEIIGNETLKDLWDISLNQLKMISGDVEKSLESFKQIEQSNQKGEVTT